MGEGDDDGDTNQQTKVQWYDWLILFMYMSWSPNRMRMDEDIGKYNFENQ